MFLFLFVRVAGEDPKKALVLLLKLDNQIYQLTGAQAVRLGAGEHVKHRLTGYVQHFSNLAQRYGGPYLDVGCAKGEISNSIALETRDLVVGIDWNSTLIEEARRNYRKDNLQFAVGDATEFLLDGQFKTIILSNVVEHIQERIKFLRKLVTQYQPKYLLVRVPNFERDWRVPLKQELGVDHRLDPTHYVEHRPEEFYKEVTEAGLKIVDMQYKWGEIWAVLSPHGNT